MKTKDISWSAHRTPRWVELAVPGHHSQKYSSSWRLRAFQTTAYILPDGLANLPWRKGCFSSFGVPRFLAEFPDHGFLLQDHLLEKLLGNQWIRGAEIIYCCPIAHRKKKPRTAKINCCMSHQMLVKNNIIWSFKVICKLNKENTRFRQE